MTQREVIDRMQEVFDRVFLDAVVLTPDLRAADVPEWDSFAQISLLVGLERAFGIRFRTGETDALGNVGEFADLIRRRLSEPGA